jgi:hypothetical protein
MAAMKTATSLTTSAWDVPAMLRALVLIGIVAVLALSPNPAHAGSAEQIAQCKGGDGVTAEQQIDACTAVIEAGSRDGRELALSYFRRAAAYLKQQDFDSAIRDFGEGLARDAGNASAGS